MDEFTAAIEYLDQKMGRPVTVDDWKLIDDKPAAMLTDDDVAISGYFGGPKSAAAVQARRDQALAPAPLPPAAQPTTNTKAARKPVTIKTIEKALLHFGDIIFPKLAARFKELEQDVNELEAEIAALKARPLQKWAGTHVAGTEYAEASLVTRQGSLWAAMRTTTTTPGDPGGDWRLIVKKGSL